MRLSAISIFVRKRTVNRVRNQVKSPTPLSGRAGAAIALARMGMEFEAA